MLFILLTDGVWRRRIWGPPSGVCCCGMPFLMFIFGVWKRGRVYEVLVEGCLCGKLEPS